MAFWEWASPWRSNSTASPSSKSIPLSKAGQHGLILPFVSRVWVPLLRPLAVFSVASGRLSTEMGTKSQSELFQEDLGGDAPPDLGNAGEAALRDERCGSLLAAVQVVRFRSLAAGYALSWLDESNSGKREGKPHSPSWPSTRSIFLPWRALDQPQITTFPDCPGST